uniref:Uncharacterized protein n=1 Tax=Nelumbo nucifera TaxID=4432 RepID=A0A822ZNL1_NELNU|nr:TPA_asm: hypothetical protein HUJ06_004280 [Nelumbo nucifera]
MIGNLNNYNISTRRKKRVGELYARLLGKQNREFGG